MPNGDASVTVNVQYKEVQQGSMVSGSIVDGPIHKCSRERESRGWAAANRSGIHA